GVFVLVKTSNPGSGMFQDLILDGGPMFARVGSEVGRLSKQTAGQCGYGLAGAVVGAPYPGQEARVRDAMPHTWFLVPGYGSQGATARDVASAFGADGLGAIVNNSRALIFAHARPEYARFGEANWQAAVEAATQAMIDELRAHTSVGKL